jgi:hypothetical protein
MVLETGDVRKRVKQAIEEGKRATAQQRADRDRAQVQFDAVLRNVAAPLFRQIVSALRAEGYLFAVSTPAESVRIASERSSGDYLELVLDSERRPPTVLLRTGHTRGRHVVEDERAVHEGPDLAGLDEDRLLDAVMEALGPLVGR